jgi:hypothetical protein
MVGKMKVALPRASENTYGTDGALRGFLENMVLMHSLSMSRIWRMGSLLDTYARPDMQYRRSKPHSYVASYP